jgi:hypothetical protein
MFIKKKKKKWSLKFKEERSLKGSKVLQVPKISYLLSSNLSIYTKHNIISN